MRTLVLNEIYLLRKYLLQIGGVLIAACILFFQMPHFLNSYFTIFPIIFVSVSLPQLSFTLEERGNTIAFLRSLPLSPRAIVGAKYLVAFTVNICFWLLLVFLSSAVPEIGISRVTISVVVLLASLLSAISYYAHFLLGVSAAKNASLVFIFATGAPLMLLDRNPDLLRAILESAAVRNFQSISGSLVGPVLALGVGAVILFISAQLASRVFTARDINQLP